MRFSESRSSLGRECCPPLPQAFKPVRLDRAKAVGQSVTAGGQDCKTLKTILRHQHVAMHIVSLSLTAGALLFPGSAVADTVQTQPSKTEVHYCTEGLPANQQCCGLPVSICLQPDN